MIYVRLVCVWCVWVGVQCIDISSFAVSVAFSNPLLIDVCCMNIESTNVCVVGYKYSGVGASKIQAVDMDGNSVNNVDIGTDIPDNDGVYSMLAYSKSEMFGSDALVYRGVKSGEQAVMVVKYSSQNGQVAAAQSYIRMTGSLGANKIYEGCKIALTVYAVFGSGASNEIQKVDLGSGVTTRADSAPSSTNLGVTQAEGTGVVFLVLNGIGLYDYTGMTLTKKITTPRDDQVSGLLDSRDKDTYFVVSAQGYIDSFSIKATVPGARANSLQVASLVSDGASAIVEFGTSFHLLAVGSTNSKQVIVYFKANLTVAVQISTQTGNPVVRKSIGYGKSTVDSSKSAYYDVFTLEGTSQSASDYTGKVARYKIVEANVAGCKGIGCPRLVLVATKWDSNTKIFSIEFDEVIDSKTFDVVLVFRLFDSSGNILLDARFSEIKMLGNRMGISGRLRIDSPPTNMTILVAAFNNQLVFESYSKNYPDLPITIQIPAYHVAPVNVIDPAPARAVGSVVQSATIVGSAVGSVASSVSSSAGSGATSIRGLLKMVDSLQYLLYENGDRLEKADNFLKPFKQNAFEVFPNPFEVDEDKIYCEPEINFSREGLSCNMLNNYGSEIFSVFLVVVIFGFLSISQLLVNKYLDKQKRWVFYLDKTVYYLLKYFSLSFMMDMWDGFQVEIIQFSLLNMNNYNKNKYQDWGLFFSITLFVLYVLYATLIFFYCKYRLALSRKTEDRSWIRHMKRCSKLEFLFDNFLPAERVTYPWMYFIPFARLARVFIIQLCIVLIADKGQDQVKLIFLLELAFMGQALLYNHLEGFWYALSYKITTVGFFSIQFFFLLFDYTKTQSGNKTRTFYSVVLILLYITLIFNELLVLIVESVLELREAYKKWEKKRQEKEMNERYGERNGDGGSHTKAVSHNTNSEFSEFGERKIMQEVPDEYNTNEYGKLTVHHKIELSRSHRQIPSNHLPANASKSKFNNK